MSTNKMRNLICLCGYKRHGKDAFFRHLSGIKDPNGRSKLTFRLDNDLPPLYKPTRYATSDLLKLELEDKMEPCYDKESMRKTYYNHGLSRRSQDKYYFARSVVKLIEKNERDVVVTDVRFNDDLEFFKNIAEQYCMRFSLIRIIGEGKDVYPDDPSENEMLEWKYDNIVHVSGY